MFWNFWRIYIVLKPSTPAGFEISSFRGDLCLFAVLPCTSLCATRACSMIGEPALRLTIENCDISEFSMHVLLSEILFSSNQICTKETLLRFRRNISRYFLNDFSFSFFWKEHRKKSECSYWTKNKVKICKLVWRFDVFISSYTHYIWSPPILFEDFIGFRFSKKKRLSDKSKKYRGIFYCAYERTVDIRCAFRSWFPGETFHSVYFLWGNIE